LTWQDKINKVNKRYTDARAVEKDEKATAEERKRAKPQRRIAFALDDLDERVLSPARRKQFRGPARNPRRAPAGRSRPHLLSVARSRTVENVHDGETE
jgi:hypothetical protein